MVMAIRPSIFGCPVGPWGTKSLFSVLGISFLGVGSWDKEMPPDTMHMMVLA
jgi:hypothetical protein